MGWFLLLLWIVVACWTAREYWFPSFYAMRRKERGECRRGAIVEMRNGKGLVYSRDGATAAASRKTTMTQMEPSQKKTMTVMDSVDGEPV
jgi:hypothetical protein